jgi:hypothetical protein
MVWKAFEQSFVKRNNRIGALMVPLKPEATMPFPRLITVIQTAVS